MTIINYFVLVLDRSIKNQSLFSLNLVNFLDLVQIPNNCMLQTATNTVCTVVSSATQCKQELDCKQSFQHTPATLCFSINWL